MSTQNTLLADLGKILCTYVLMSNITRLLPHRFTCDIQISICCDKHHSVTDFQQNRPFHTLKSTFYTPAQINLYNIRRKILHFVKLSLNLHDCTNLKSKKHKKPNFINYEKIYFIFDVVVPLSRRNGC